MMVRISPVAWLCAATAAAAVAGGIGLGVALSSGRGHPPRAAWHPIKTPLLTEAIESIKEWDTARPAQPAIERAAVAGMAARLHLRHLPRAAAVNPPLVAIGATLVPDAAGWRVLHVFAHSPAARAGLKAGDLLLQAAGHSVRHSSYAAVAARIAAPAGTTVTLEVSRAGARKTIAIVRGAMASPPAVASQLRTTAGKQVGWVCVSSLARRSLRTEIAQAAHTLLREGARGMVLDLRGLSGGNAWAARAVGSLWLPRGAAITQVPATAHPTVRAAGGAIPSSIPMVVLVDHATAEAANAITEALQYHKRAKVVGTRTAPGDRIQLPAVLRDGDVLWLPAAEFRSPIGLPVGKRAGHGSGVTPEINVNHGVDTEHGLQVALGAVANEIPTTPKERQ